jgi:NB-ARC domain/APAF-1 helical domain
MQQENRENATGIQAEARDNSTVHVAETINIYESSRPPRGIPFQALALPKDYVDRPEIRQKIKSKLIDCSVSRPGTLVVSAIYGLGGVGKSVMAAALAHDREVQDVCADGVLWVTLGQNPDLLPCLYGWVQALGDYDFNPTTIDSASSHLRSLLRDKKMLLVVDDAWQCEHVTPFQVGGEGCRVLVTTREAHMEVMSEAEALELLLSKAQVKSLTTEEEEQAKKLIGAVGGLPLAVDLAGAQIADGLSWDELLRDLEAEIAYLESLDRPNADGVRDEKTRKRLSLKASLNLSLKILTAEQLQQFAWLGVLPEDVSIQPDMAATLWSIPLRQAKAILRNFRAKALLLSGVQGVGQEFSYRIHDLMHDLARGLLTGEGEKDIPGLALKWQDAHGILLDRYRQQAKDNQWHTLPNDGYIYSYLTWHMEQAGRLSEVHGLFQEVTAEGRNAWYETCDFLGQNAKFVIDLGRAWQLAEEKYEEDTLQLNASGASEAIGLQVRYALIFSTLNTLASKIPAKLIAALVKNGKWSSAQGLAYAKQAQESSKRSEILQELAAFIIPSLLSEALEVVREIQEEYFRAKVLSALAAHLPENLFAEALEVACEIQEEYFRAYALSGLAAHLPEIASEALEIARGIQDESDRADALNRLAAHLPENLLSEALEVARGIQSESDRANALSEFAAHLPEIASEALEVVRGIQSEFDRAFALSKLAPYLPENLLSEALEVARGIQEEYFRAYALSGLAAHLPEIASEALEIARGIQSESDRANALSRLAPYLPENLLSEALEVIRGIQDEYCRAKALSELAAQLPENLLLEALEVIRGIQHEDDRANALSEFAAHLPEIASEALEVARGIQFEYFRIDVLSRLAPYLPENLLSEALEVARGIQDEDDRANALSGLAAHLPEIASEALEIARGIQSESDRANALSRLAPHLPENLLSEALEVIRGIQDEYCRAKALSELAAHLPENLLLEALEVIRGIQDEDDRAKALSGLAAHLPEIASEALEVARGIQDDYFRAKELSGLAPQLLEALFFSGVAEVISGLAPYLPENLLSEALVIARGIESEDSRVKALSGLAAHSPEIVSEALEVARGIQDEYCRAKALSGLAAHLSENLLSEALEIARRIQSELNQAEVMSGLETDLVEDLFFSSVLAEVISGLAPHLPENLLSEALEIACEIQDEYFRIDVMSGLAPYLPENLLSEALEVACGIQSEDDRAKALSGLAPYLPENLLSEALEVACGIQSESSRAHALSGLATHLPENLLSEALEVSHGIQSESSRADALSGLATQIDLKYVNSPFWSKVLHTLAHRNRKHLLEDISKLAPAIIKLSDRSTLILVVQAMREVCQQWP